MIRLPLQTAPKWSNEDLRNAAPDTVSLKLTEKQFPKYKDNIFSPDIRSALEKEDTYFAFIFGKVGQEYKLTGFYTKWPIRD